MGLNYGIDFRGGTLMEVLFTKGADLSTCGRASTAWARGCPDPGIRRGQRSDDPRREQAGGEQAQQEAVRKVQAALGHDIELRRTRWWELSFPRSCCNPRSSPSPSPRWDLSLSRFRFEWQFSVSAIVALLHDIAFTLCVLSIFQIDFDLTIVAALLTLIGYAVNDTVVTFDRVRENLRKYKKCRSAS